MIRRAALVAAVAVVVFVVVTYGEVLTIELFRFLTRLGAP